MVSLDESVDSVNDMRNDEEEVFEGMMSMENVGHNLRDHYLQYGS
jgi:hypothetical protein